MTTMETKWSCIFIFERQEIMWLELRYNAEEYTPLNALSTYLALPKKTGTGGCMRSISRDEVV